MAKKYFGTDGVRGKVGMHPITPNFSMKLGNAVGQVLRDADLPLTVLVGQDTRRSSDMLKAACFAGVTAAGVDVVNLGIVPTPVIAFMVKELKLGAGVVLSASHNPYYDNGIKLFSHEGYKLSDEMEYQIENYIDQGFYYEAEGQFGQVSSQVNQVKAYIDYCLSCFAHKIDLASKRIVVDCANGAMFRVAKEVFTCLGLETVEIASTPDGLNINKDCGAVHLRRLKTAVVNEKANLGIAFDGDGDRIMLVDEKGCVFNGDDILLLLAKHSSETVGIVGTVMTNLGTEQEFLKRDLLFKRAKVGDRYVMELLLENGWLLGGESSGHIINLRYNTTGDGLMAALQILTVLSEVREPLSKLLDNHKLPQRMINVPLNQKLNSDDMNLLIKDVNFVRKNLGSDGRVVLRPSGTEPVLRVMVEARTDVQVQEWLHYLVAQVKKKLCK